LNDIRFEFAVGKDSAEGIASELVGAGLVDGKDINVITQNLQKLIDSRDMIKVVTFPLVTIQLKTRYCFLLYFNFRIRD
jgi:serine/threonine-protein kinase OSR1/STK39